MSRIPLSALLLLSLAACSGSGVAAGHETLDRVTDVVNPIYAGAEGGCATAILHNAKTCPDRATCEARHTALTEPCDKVVAAGECIREAQVQGRRALTTISECSVWPANAASCGWLALGQLKTAQDAIARCSGQLAAAWTHAQERGVVP